VALSRRVNLAETADVMKSYLRSSISALFEVTFSAILCSNCVAERA
jgi:hypothetical protein